MLREILRQKGIRYLRAAYFFGDAAPMTCWDAFRDAVVDSYLDRIKADGFNCIILVIPGSMPEIEAQVPRYGRSFWTSLAMVMQRAAARGLYVLFRLNYIWDRFPIKFDRYRLSLVQQIPGRPRDRLQDFLMRLWAHCCYFDNFLFSFITWEDATMYMMDEMPKKPTEDRAEIAKMIGYTLEDGTTLDGLQQIVPRSADPQFKHYLDFIDVWLIDFYRFVEKVFPPLTMEVRCDTYPYRDRDGAVHHHVHAKAYNIPQADIIGTYYGIYMRAANNHEQISAEQAFENFKLVHDLVLSQMPHSETPLVFVDQFLFSIQERAYSHFAWMDDGSRIQFIKMCAEWMQQHSAGFAVWSFQDYLSDLISNSAFVVGLDGWTHSGPVVSGNGASASAGCVIKAGGSLSQPLIRRLDRVVILIVAQSLEDAEIEVSVSADEKFVTRLPKSDKPERTVHRLQKPASFLAIKVLKGAVRLCKASAGVEVASHGGYPLDFTETTNTAALVELNKRLGAGETAPTTAAEPGIASTKNDKAKALSAKPVKPAIRRLLWPTGTALVSIQHKIVYMPIAKNACSSLKRMMLALSDLPAAKEMPATVGIHQYLANNKTGLMLRDRDIDEATRIIADRTWLKFVVLRNPFDRLVSGYLQKFASDPRRSRDPLAATVPIIEWVYRQRGHEPDHQRSITFREFVNYLASHDDMKLDTHWRPQTCYLTGIEYDLFARMEDMTVLRTALESRLGRPLQIGTFNVTPRAKQGSGRYVADTVAAEIGDMDVFPSVSDFVDAELEAAIGRRYGADIELYRRHFGETLCG